MKYSIFIRITGDLVRDLLISVSKDGWHQSDYLLFWMYQTIRSMTFLATIMLYISARN